MSSYGGAPGASPLDTVRFVVGDTTEPFWLTDAEWQFLIDQADGDVNLAALRGAQGLLARFSYAVDETVGAVSIQVSQRIANLQGIIAMLNDRLSQFGAAMPYAGGIDWTDRQSRAHDPTKTRPFFDPRRCDGWSDSWLLGRTR